MTTQQSKSERIRVVIIGAGFGGLWAASELAGQDLDVIVIDKNNYHTFLALLYQVAAAELEAEDIAYPIRSIFWKQSNINFILAKVRKVNTDKKFVEIENDYIFYDYLIVATGSVTDSFNIPGVEINAYFLKTLEEAVKLKNHIICCFETASREADKIKRKELLSFVIVGGGATGIEYAGALSELIHGPLIKDYRNVNFNEVRIILLETSDRLVAQMPQKVRIYTLKKLEEMGVNVLLNAKVKKITSDKVIINEEDEIQTKTAIWSAGVRGEPLAQLSDIATEKNGRVLVKNTLQTQEHPDIYVIGDLACIKANNHNILPMVAQVAIQSGIAAAKNILRQISSLQPQPFQYRDRGSMITIGRKSAGVSIGKRTFTGFIAWIIWLTIHLFNLIGFRNRIMVLINWAWDYLLYERAVRFVFPSEISSGHASSSCNNSNNDQKIR